jgi:hypothetical protein
MRRQTRRSSPILQDYVSHFELRDLVVRETLGVRPLPARPAQLLIFHLGDISGSDLLYHRTGEIIATPLVGILGPQTFRVVDALWKGRFRDFVVAFRPTGFYRQGTYWDSAFGILPADRGRISAQRTVEIASTSVFY